ncbi:MAG: shikimate kinase [Anaerolineae bacterium]|nr:shikimate kinase [Anaerolineae bacterium]
MMMFNPIVLIGPRGVDLDGVGRLLAEQLQKPFHSIYDYSDEEWKHLGYDPSAEIMAIAKGGMYAGYQQLMPMRLRAVEKILADFPNDVIALPAEFVIYDDADLQAQMAHLLATIPNVVLLTPSADDDELAKLLDADLADFPDYGEVNAYWVRNPSNRRLAKQVVYTKGKSEAQTRDEILQLKSEQEPSEIILIGPKLTGKTTIGRMLADALGLRQASLDAVTRKYFAETDYDRQKASQIHAAEGIFGSLRYRQPYDAYVIECVLRDEHQCVIDFGGGHSVYEDESSFERAQTALAPYANVFLILPSPDEDESIAILKQRFKVDVASERRLQRWLVTHPTYQELAKHIVYTKDRSPQEIGAEIGHMLR